MYGDPHRKERYCTQEGTGEMGLGRDGRVIDLHLLTGREGGRRRGPKKVSVGWYCAVRMRVERRRWYF